MKKTASIFIAIALFIYGKGQSKIINEVFRLLPANKIYGLTLPTRDSILRGKTYYPSDNDSNSIEAYNYGISSNVKSYMYVSMSYETAQRASGMIEIRSFKTTKGENLIVVSETAGVWPINYQQNDLSLFIYNGSKKLIPYKKMLLPPADETLFIKSGIPDSIKQKIMDNSNIIFDFSTEKPTLELNSDYLTDNALIKKWLKGNFVEFAWSGDRFTATKIDFKK